MCIENKHSTRVEFIFATISYIRVYMLRKRAFFGILGFQGIIFFMFKEWIQNDLSIAGFRVMGYG